MGQYLYMVRPARADMLTAGPTEAESGVIARHFEYLQRLTREGVVLLAGRTQDVDPEGRGLIIFRAEGEAAARVIVDGDPAVRAGVFLARLFPYRVALLARPDLQAPWVPAED